MGRVSAFIKASNEHREVSLGGRQRNRTVEAWLNTDNELHRDCGMRVSAIGGGARSIFDVQLPGEVGSWTAWIRVPDVLELRRRGCNLDGSTPSLQQLQQRYADLREIYLPGNVNLAQALACVDYCGIHGVLDWAEIRPQDDAELDVDRRRRNIIR
jgi:hypothetical protein